MAAGRPPFAAATSIDTLVSILEKEPSPLAEYTPEAPAEFQRIVNKSLRKDREERYQTIKDLLIDLKSLKEERSFAQKLERSRPSGAPLTTNAATKATGVVATDQRRALAAAADPSAQRMSSRNRRLVPAALAVVLLAR